MSRRDRDGRDSDSKRHRSGFDKEPSPRSKRSRRDGKLEIERDLGAGNKDQKQGRHRQIQDGLPLEPPLTGPDSSKEAERKDDSEKKPNDGTKHFPDDPTQVPRSRSYFQHDERGNAAQVGRSLGRRAATERRWRDSKDDRHGKATNKSTTYESQQRDERLQAKGDEDGVWRHDGFLKMEAEPPPAVRKRPAFREKKIPVETENSNKSVVDPARPSRSDHPVSLSERREERERNPRHSDRPERPAAGNRGEAQRGTLPPRERYGGTGGGSYRGRERFSGRQSYHPSAARGEKWKHDLFDESNESPTTKNEEDQIAKIEALLAS